MTTFPLGILFANGGINQEEYNAGTRFAWLYAAVVGKHSLAAIEFERSNGRSIENIDEEKEKDLQEKYRNTLDILDSRIARDEIISLCVYERIPRFMRPIMPVPKDMHQAQIIKAGLKGLAKGFGYVYY